MGERGGVVKADGGDDRWARGEEKMVEVQNSKPRCSRAKKFTKILLKLEQISKIIFEEESLKNLL